MSGIGSIGNYGSFMSGMRSAHRPDPEQVAQNLFAKLDTAGKGYIDKAGLQQAFDKVGASKGSSGATAVDEVFAQLDSDSDGKVTKQEFTDTLSKLAQQLDHHAMGRRVRGGGHGHDADATGGVPPPPPPQGGTGTSTNEATDTATSSSDASGSGTSSTTSTAPTADSAAGATTTSDAQALRQVIRLMHAYSVHGDKEGSSTSSALSVSA